MIKLWASIVGIWFASIFAGIVHHKWLVSGILSLHWYYLLIPLFYRCIRGNDLNTHYIVSEAISLNCWACFKAKMPCHQCGNSHYKIKTISYHLVFVLRIPISGKMVLILKLALGIYRFKYELKVKMCVLLSGRIMLGFVLRNWIQLILAMTRINVGTYNSPGFDGRFWLKNEESVQWKLVPYLQQNMEMNQGFILGMGWANERRRYIVTSSLIGWAHAKVDLSAAETWMFQDILNTMAACFLQGRISVTHAISALKNDVNPLLTFLK